MIDRLLSCLMAVSLALLIWLYARSREQETLDNVPVPVEVVLSTRQGDQFTLELPGGQSLPIKFFLDDARLMAQAQGQPANEMRYLGNYAFGVAFDPALRFTFTIDAGKSTRVRLFQGGATIVGPRVP